MGGFGNGAKPGPKPPEHNFCDDQYMEVEGDLLSIINRSETLILPIASIIETGNHIAHISDGSIRRAIARSFAQYLRDTADDTAPWSLIKKCLFFFTIG